MMTAVTQVLACCGADASHKQHSWERWRAGRSNWYCTACDADSPEILRPSLEGRVARCLCGKEVPSDRGDHPFFQHQPNVAKDSYYCGCRGWD